MFTWREYIEQNNPIAAALLSKMGFRTEERQLQQELKSLEHSEEAKIMELRTNWGKKAEVKGKVDFICMYLQTKYGESSSLIQQKVSLIRNNELLDQTLYLSPVLSQADI